jgi:hypothetical protein
VSSRHCCMGAKWNPPWCEAITPPSNVAMQCAHHVFTVSNHIGGINTDGCMITHVLEGSPPAQGAAAGRRRRWAARSRAPAAAGTGPPSLRDNKAAAGDQQAGARHLPLEQRPTHSSYKVTVIDCIRMMQLQVSCPRGEGPGERPGLHHSVHTCDTGLKAGTVRTHVRRGPG